MQTQLSRTTPHILAIVAVALCVTGCAAVGERTGELFSSNTPAVAAWDGRVLWGKANFTAAHEATLLLQDTQAPALSCSGSLRYTATTSGMVGLTCSNGQTITLPFQALSGLSGTGRSQMGNTSFTLTYGLAPDKAAGYLGLPPERLVRPAAP